MRFLSVLALVLAVLIGSAGLAAAAPLRDDPITVAVTADLTTVRTGDHVKLLVSVTHPPGIMLQFPEPAALQTPAVEVLRVEPGSGARSLTGTLTTVTEYTLGAFAPGSHAIPDVTVGYETAEGLAGAVTVAHGIGLTVESVLASQPNASLQDIRPPLALPLPPGAQVRPVATAVLVGALAMLTLILLRRLLRGRRITLTPVSALSPEGRARGALADAALLLTADAPDYGAYYTAVSLAIRAYLEARTGLAALSSTTRELRRGMELRGTDRWHARVIWSLLDECEAVKWAHYVPDPARAARALTMGHEVVDLVEAAMIPATRPAATLTPIGAQS